MYYLIYISKATGPMGEGDLSLLLTESQAYNEAHDLSGLLVYIEGSYITHTEGRFMQMLEGTKAEVEKIYEKIKVDERHYDIVLLKFEPLEKRNYGNWSMKLEKIDITAHPELESFFQFDTRVLQSEVFQKSDLALRFLQSF